jgi:hypothetical protein
MAGRYDRLITKIYSDPADVAIAKKFVAAFEHEPAMDGRIEALLREAARPNSEIAGGNMTPDQAWAYLKDYAFQLGTPPHLLSTFDRWIDQTAAELPNIETVEAQPAEAEKPAEPAQPPRQAAAQPPVQPQPAVHVRPAPAVPDREAAQRLIYETERAMREPQGSDGWNGYWRNPQAQAAYRQALDVVHGSPEPSLAPGTLAEGVAADVRAAIAATPAAGE